MKGFQNIVVDVLGDPQVLAPFNEEHGEAFEEQLREVIQPFKGKPINTQLLLDVSIALSKALKKAFPGVPEVAVLGKAVPGDDTMIDIQVFFRQRSE